MQVNFLARIQRRWIVLVLPVTLLLVGVVLLAGRSTTGTNTIVVTTTEDEEIQNDNCSLREAIRAANSDKPVDACSGGDSVDNIVLPPGRYRVSLRNPLEVRSDLNINGSGNEETFIYIEGPATSSIFSAFEITGGTFSISGVNIHRWTEISESGSLQ